jgi:lysophospholipase L1-like esterase
MSMSWINLRKTSAHTGEDGAHPGRVDIKSFYGLTEPYDFTRALALITAIALLCLIVAAMAITAYSGKLHWGTYRFIYFVYLASLAVAAGALSFAPKLAWPLIALSFIDFALGVGTGLGHQLQIARSMLPIDNVKHEFTFHPLLQVVPSPSYAGAELSPFIKHHDSYGLRGVERDKGRLKQQVVVAAVGGSTTYDIGVADGHTWPDVLERELGNDYAVLNHGVPGYSTAEHLIQTLFYLEPYDTTPQCAIYYVGWNDIHNAHIPNLDPGYADFHLMTKFVSMQARRKPLAAEVSPLASTVVRYLQVWVDTIPAMEDFSGQPPMPGSDPRLERIFRRNLEAIAAINAKRGIKSIFVGQLLNRARLQDTKTEIWWPLIRDVDLLPLQIRFNGILKDTADATGSPALIVPIDEFQDSDFIDKGHFSEQGSQKFATMLAPLVRANCKKH